MPQPANLIHETSTTTGTGSLTVAAVNGKVRFSDVTYGFGTGGSNVFWYFISNQAAAEWEIGTGSMSDANTLVRDTILFSSNSNNAVNFSAGTKDVTNDVPAASQYHIGGPDVAVADGGSGRSDAVAYAPICGGTTSTGAHQSVASVGTSGQVLTSNGAGALPTFQDASGGGGLALLTSGTVSAAATLDIVLTAYTSYRAIKIYLSSFVPATSDVELWARFSTDGGSSYDATGYSYAVSGIRDDNTEANIVSASDTKIILAGDTGVNSGVSNTASNGGADVEITLQAQTATGRFSRIRYSTGVYLATNAGAIQTGAGLRETAQDTDAIRFLFESGNIASGSYAVYGLL